MRQRMYLHLCIQESEAAQPEVVAALELVEVRPGQEVPQEQNREPGQAEQLLVEPAVQVQAAEVPGQHLAEQPEARLTEPQRGMQAAQEQLAVRQEQPTAERCRTRQPKKDLRSRRRSSTWMTKIHLLAISTGKRRADCLLLLESRWQYGLLCW